MVRKVKKRKSKLRKFMAFIIYEVFFIAFTSPFMIIYGPFGNLKRAFVASVMATRHKYLMAIFLSQDKINKILDTKDSASLNDNQDASLVSVQHKNSNNIVRHEIHNSKFDAYLLEIPDPTKVKVAMTKYLDKQGEKTSDMAKENNAVAAINGGSFLGSSQDGKQFAGTGASPDGFVISDGEVIYKNRDMDSSTKLNTVAFDDTGRLIVGDHSINELKAMDTVEAITFRDPTLIVNGKGQIRDKMADGLAPRTAVGQKSDGTVLFLVVDGRSSLTKLGVSLYDVQSILLQYGAVNAGNLDGGYSATMYYDGDVINNPSEWDGERTVATALYIEK